MDLSELNCFCCPWKRYQEQMPINSLYKFKMPGNKPRSQYKKKRWDFYGVRPQEKNRPTDSDVVKVNNMAASLSSSSNTGNIDFNFSARNDAEDSDNVSKRKIENSRLAYDEVQEDTLPSKDKKIDKNQSGPSRRRSERLSHLEKPTVAPPAACSNLKRCKFIYSNVLNELISNTPCCHCKSSSLQLYQKDATWKRFDERSVVYCHNCNFYNEHSTSCKSNTKP